MDVDPKSAVVTGASSDVGALVQALPTAEVELLEDEFEDDDEEDDGDEEDEFKVGDVVVYCGAVRLVCAKWWVEPGDVGTVVGPDNQDDRYDVIVDFPQCKLHCRHRHLRLHTKGGRKAIAEGIPPKRLWSAIDHAGESPGQPEGKARWHGQAVDGFGAQSQDYGTKFVNGNKGIG